MLGALKKLISELTDNPTRRSVAIEQRRLAAAALLVHVAAIDGVSDPREADRVRDLLRARFDLDANAAGELMAAAQERDREAVDLYAFTRLLKTGLDETGRLEIIDMMWEVAFADNLVHEFEENVIWRVAELLGVPARDRLAARKRAARASAGSDA